MRIILLIGMLFSFVAVKAQSVLPFGAAGYQQAAGVNNDTYTSGSVTNQKWFLSSYRTLTTGVSFFNGGNATIFAAPMGVQLNRRLNKNLYAFANATIAPAYINFNRSFITAGSNKNCGYNTTGINSFDIYPAVSLGLMYINDQKTFSISGSISAERSNYPLLPYYPTGSSRQRNVVSSPR